MKQKLKRIFLHFDDELGILSMAGSGLAGAGLMAVLAEPSGGLLSQPALTLYTGLVLIVLDYFR